MKDRQDWDIPESEGEFTLLEEIDVLDTADFDIDELEGSVESAEEKPAADEDFVSIINEDSSVAEGSVIEPSTMIEEEIIQDIREETEEAEEGTAEYEEKGEEKGISEESLKVESSEEIERREAAVSEALEKEPEEAEEYVPESSAAEESEKFFKKEEEAEMQARFKQEDINAALKSFLDISPDFLAAAIVSADGFVIASALPENVEENKLGAMSAAILSLGERAAKELDKGNLETVFVEGENGYVLLSSVNPEILLVVSTTRYAKLGLVFYELSALKKTIKTLFD